MFILRWTKDAAAVFEQLRSQADAIQESRSRKLRTKPSRAEGLFKQVEKALRFLQTNPKHPGLQSHEFQSFEHPFDKKQKVWEAYVQNATPGAYRIFWCYGPEKNQLTIIALLQHP